MICTRVGDSSRKSFREMRLAICCLIDGDKLTENEWMICDEHDPVQVCKNWNSLFAYQLLEHNKVIISVFSLDIYFSFFGRRERWFPVVCHTHMHTRGTSARGIVVLPKSCDFVSANIDLQQKEKVIATIERIGMKER